MSLENRIAPWVKVKDNGTLYVDPSNKRGQRLMLAQLEFLTQYEIINGGLTRTKDKGLDWPNWEEYAFGPESNHPHDPSLSPHIS